MAKEKEFAHYGTRSWWNGVFRSLCGVTFDVSRSAPWTAPTCPVCKRLKKDGGR